MIVCKPLSAQDHVQVFALGAQLFREEDVPEIGNALATACAPSTVLLAPTGHVAGFALFCRGQCISTKTSPNHRLYSQVLGKDLKTVELAFLAIDPAYQGAGLGSKLLAHCLGQLPPEAVCWLVTEVDNTAAARLYAKHGFHNLHTIADAYPCPLYLWIRPGKFDIHMSPFSIPPTLSKCPRNAALSSTMIT